MTVNDLDAFLVTENYTIFIKNKYPEAILSDVIRYVIRYVLK